MTLAYSLAGAPADIVIDPVTGVISGIPAAGGLTSGLVVTATNAAGSADSNAFNADIEAIAPIESPMIYSIRTPTALYEAAVPFKHFPEPQVMDVVINWGDGSADEHYTSGYPEHVYDVAGEYDITITGHAEQFAFEGGGDKEIVFDIKQWGRLGITNMDSAFFQCPLLVDITATDGLVGVAVLASFLSSNGALRSVDFSNWDVSNCTGLDIFMFDCSVISDVDVSSFDVSNVQWMYQMFDQCNALSSIGDVSGWVTSSLVDMADAFALCPNLSGVDPSNWDVSNVTSASRMFTGSPDAMTVAVYDSLLEKWGAQVVQPNVPFDSGGVTYTAGGAAEAGRNALVAAGWIITDGGVTP